MIPRSSLAILRRFIPAVRGSPDPARGATEGLPAPARKDGPLSKMHGGINDWDRGRAVGDTSVQRIRYPRDRVRERIPRTNGVSRNPLPKDPRTHHPRRQRLWDTRLAVGQLAVITDQLSAVSFQLLQLPVISCQ